MRFVWNWFLRDELPTHLRDFLDVPALSPVDEARLLAEAKMGDDDASRQVVRANMALVIRIAQTYRRRPIPFDDLVQEGIIGLMHAIERFDPEGLPILHLRHPLDPRCDWPRRRPPKRRHPLVNIPVLGFSAQLSPILHV